MATVILDRVTKSFKDRRKEVRAVNELSLRIAERELLVLVGPSGCGKTTTLRIIAGLEELTSGSVCIGGRDVSRLAPQERDVAMVFQNYALYPHMSVYKNIAFGLRMRRVPKNEIQRRTGEAAALLGIAHLLERKPSNLSGGERQRVALARAIVRKPNVFLLDEPLSNLDARQRVHTRTELKALQRRVQTTMIYVTHDQEEAMTLGDRTVVLNAGVAQQCGEPLEIYNRPANRFVAWFMGAPAMNLLEGTIEGNGGVGLFACKLGRLNLPTQLWSELRPHDGRGVVLGFRAEHARVTQAGGAKPDDRLSTPSGGLAAVRDMTVRVVEPLGHTTLLHLSSPGGASVVVAHPPECAPSIGQRIGIAIEMARGHFFSADEAGLRING